MTEEITLGRNEPCPCKSGKKYKRCCGAGAAPKLTTPKQSPMESGGFDPKSMENIDPQMMMQMSQALQRLPRGQMQRLQTLMQKAMSGKDISAEAAEFEKTLPPDFQSLMLSLAGSFGGGGDVSPLPLPEESADMTLDQARNVIQKAIAEGSISPEEGEKLLAASINSPQLALPESSPENPLTPEQEKELKSLETLQTSPTSKGEPSKLGKFWGKITQKKEPLNP